jgi:glycosyltransferase involved in cell wall biosynthesis
VKESRRLLSVIINVRNGEATINRCLSSLQSFSDIVVFDNYSTDKTLEIAAKYSNVNIVQHEFCGMGTVRNLAMAHAKHDWVLFIDCDEVLHPDLTNYLLHFDFILGTVYSFLRRNYYANTWVNSSAWENDWVVRLYNRNETSYSEVQVHEGVILNNLKLVQINNSFIYHFPYNKISQLIDKMQLYSTWYAKQNYPHKRPNIYLLPFRAVFMFIKCYVLKRGFVDGFAGFAVSSYNAIGVFSKYMKLYELYYNCALGLAIRVTTAQSLLALNAYINSQKLLPQHVYILVDDKLTDAISKSLGDCKLCISYTVVSIHTSDNSRWIEEAKNMAHLDYIVYLENNDLLYNVNLLKNCKKSIQANKKLDKIRLIDLR